MGVMKQLMLEQAFYHPEASLEEVAKWRRPGVTQEMVRAEVLKRADRRCEGCGWYTQLELHHRHYRSVGHEIPSDYAALCRDCHQARHIDRNGEFVRDPEICPQCGHPIDRMGQELELDACFECYYSESWM